MTKQTIADQEKAFLKAVNWDIEFITPCTFLNEFLYWGSIEEGEYCDAYGFQ